LLQLAWVAGGALGLLALPGTWAFGVAALALVVGLVFMIRSGLHWRGTEILTVEAAHR